MFTGIVETTGVIRQVKPANPGVRLWIEASFSGELAPGGSVAVDGACLTVEAVQEGCFLVFLSPETLQRTRFGEVDLPGLAVNLERPLRVGDELGGHWVLGHVDGVGTVRTVVDQKEGRCLEVELPESVHPALVIEKGSIAVNGVSLTINRLLNRRLQIQLIPYTLERTNLSLLEPGDRVNLELDMIGKYVIRYMEALHPAG